MQYTITLQLDNADVAVPDGQARACAQGIADHINRLSETECGFAVISNELVLTAFRSLVLQDRVHCNINDIKIKFDDQIISIDICGDLSSWPHGMSITRELNDDISTFKSLWS